MRVLHVSAYFAPAYRYGGPVRSILALCQAQQRHGIDLEVFTTTADGDGDVPPATAAPDDVGGVPVRRYPRSAPAWLLGAPALRAPLARAAAAADVIHVHGLWNRTVWQAGAVARATGRPYVVSPRGMLEPAARRHHRARKLAAYALFDRRVLRGAAAFHATSAAEAGTIGRAVPGARVVVAPNGVDLDPPASPGVRAALGLPADVPLVAFVGRLHPIKRLDLLADAMGHVLAAGADAHLVIAGPDELGTRRQVEPRFAPIASRVHWAGAVDVPTRTALLHEARALVLCSDSESFGMSVAEALAAGCPAVVTDTCPWADIERAGAGIVVEQRADAIARGVLAVLAGPAAADRRRDARRYAEARLSWDAAVAPLLSLYASLLPA